MRYQPISWFPRCRTTIGAIDYNVPMKIVTIVAWTSNNLKMSVSRLVHFWKLSISLSLLSPVTTTPIRRHFLDSLSESLIPGFMTARTQSVWLLNVTKVYSNSSLFWSFCLVEFFQNLAFLSITILKNLNATFNVIYLLILF